MSKHSPDHTAAVEGDRAAKWSIGVNQLRAGVASSVVLIFLAIAVVVAGGIVEIPSFADSPTEAPDEANDDGAILRALVGFGLIDLGMCWSASPGQSQPGSQNRFR